MSAWRGRRVFVTGHTGFKGSWLALWLNRLGARIAGYALDPCTEPNLFTLASVREIVTDVRGDIRDYSGLESSMTEFAPEVVFHLAAQPIVRRGYADPVGTYSSNVMGTVHVLEAVRKTPSCTRCRVCHNGQVLPKSGLGLALSRVGSRWEGMILTHPAKPARRLSRAAYRRSFFPDERLHEHHVALATARAGNVIGGGDWSEDRLVPDLVRGFCSGNPILIRRPEADPPLATCARPAAGILDACGRNSSRKMRNLVAATTSDRATEEIWPVERIATKLVDFVG